MLIWWPPLECSRKSFLPFDLAVYPIDHSALPHWHLCTAASAPQSRCRADRGGGTGRGDGTGGEIDVPAAAAAEGAGATGRGVATDAGPVALAALVALPGTGVAAERGVAAESCQQFFCIYPPT